jgi:hypothetical protein
MVLYVGTGGIAFGDFCCGLVRFLLHSSIYVATLPFLNCCHVFCMILTYEGKIVATMPQ